MSSIRISTVIAAAILSLAVAPQAAWAKKDSSATTEYIVIETTGLSAIDDVFTKVADIQTKLTEIETNLKTSNDNIATSLGLAAGTPVKDAIADLKSKAEGKIEVAMEGTTPTLKAKDGVPENVTAGIDAVNGAIKAWTDSAATVATLKSDVDALVTASKELPGKVPESAKASGLGAKDIVKATKTTGSNVKATGQTADRAKAVGEALVSNIDTVKALGN
jgi:hypothetical protein